MLFDIWQNIDNALDNKLFEYIWDLIISIISIIIGYKISQWSINFKEKKELKKKKKKFLLFYDSLRRSDIYRMFFSLKSLKIEDIELVLHCICKFDIIEFDKNSLKNTFISIDMMKWSLQIIDGGDNVKLYKWKSKEDYNFYEQKRNQEILVEFLDYIENQFKIYKIINNKNKLSKEIEFNNTMAMR